MRRQQSARFHCGTNCRILLIAFFSSAGPCLIPAISRRSSSGSHRNFSSGLLSFSLKVVRIQNISRTKKFAWLGCQDKKVN